MEARFAGFNPHAVGGQQRQQHQQQHFTGPTFPETFKDFFSMTNEDEDQIELISSLEDKVIPRHNVRGRNRSSSAKFSNTTSLLPATTVAVRSNSFRVNRNTGRVAAGNVTPNFCQHIKYCCLHQNNLTNTKAMTCLDSENFNRTELEFSDNRATKSVASQLKVDDMNGSGFSNFSDDEKSMKLTRKFSVDASINLNPSNIHNKQSLQHSYENFDTRKCNCENCSAADSCSEDSEFISKLKATNSSYCLMRHNRSVNQLRSNERSSSGVSNISFNYSGNSAVLDKSTESIALTAAPTSSNRKQMELNRQKSPILNRRRASSVNIARTVPNFGSSTIPQTSITPSAHNQNDLYRYMKSDEQQQSLSSHGNRLENREMYSASSSSIARSKSPNMFNRKTLDSNSSAVNKTNAAANVGVGGQKQPLQQQRARTASMPVENRKPRLADCSRRSAIHCADVDMEYYRLRSFSITSHGICNLGDSMRSRRSRSINSVTSSNSGRDRNNSTSSQHIEELGSAAQTKGEEDKNVAYKIAMLGDSAVGKSSLTYQFTTSEYICAYDLSLDDDYGQKTVSVLLNNQETDLEVIDHPACEMSVEAFCSTYNIDLFVIAYSVVDRKSFKSAERVLLYLKENEMLLTRGAILVGNKTDLERQREVSTHAGRKLAKEIGCKFIETSSGLNHKVDELLVGIVAQVKLNPQRIRNLSEKQRNNLGVSMQQKFKGTNDHQDHFSKLRRNERNKSNTKMDAGKDTSKADVENEDESDDERSDESSDDSDIEKYFNLENNITGGGKDKSLIAVNMSKLLKSRRHATPGMTQSHYGIINAFFSDDREVSSTSNNNLSTSSCSTPTNSYPPLASSSSKSASATYAQTKIINKRDYTPSYENKNNPLSSSQPATPKKSNLSGTENESDTGAEKCINKFSNRTKMFLTSFLKFKRSLRVKRRNSNSCSDLFVI